MRDTGLHEVQRLDEALFQPVRRELKPGGRALSSSVIVIAPV